MRYLIVVLWLFPMITKAQDIITIESLKVIGNTAQPGDWVVFDIDQTLLEGPDHVREVVTLVKNLQMKGIRVFCLTATSYGRREEYDRRLTYAGFNMRHSSQQLTLEDIHSDSFNNEHHGFYGGILFAKRNQEVEESIKGPVFEKFLKLIEEATLEMPKRLIFVDDQLRNLESVKEVLPDLPKILYHLKDDRPLFLPRSNLARWYEDFEIMQAIKRRMKKR